MDTASPGEKRQLGSIYTKRVLEPDDVAAVTAILDSAGSRDFATTTAAGLVEEAVAELDAASTAFTARRTPSGK